MSGSGEQPAGHASVLLVANPRAGGTGRQLVAEAEAICRRHRAGVDVLWCAGRGHPLELVRDFLTTAAAKASLPSAVVSIGGDGTFREVAGGLLEARLPAPPAVVVLPGGTGNSNYRSLWDDVPWQEALTAALTGEGAELRWLDLAAITSPPRLVVLGASTGVFAEATAEARALDVPGRARYRVAIDAVLARHRPYPGRVVIDGTVLHEGGTALVNVGGGRHRAGVYHVLPQSVRDDGLLDVCVIDGRADAGRALERMRAGGHPAGDGVHYGRGRRITVERTDRSPLLFETDGEVVPDGGSSFTIEVRPAALPVLASCLRPGG